MVTPDVVSARCPLPRVRVVESDAGFAPSAVARRCARWLASTLIALVFVVPSPAQAQGAVCVPAVSPMPVGVIVLNPGAPVEGQSVSISAGLFGFVPSSATAQVQGSTITVTLSGVFLAIGLPPPQIVCASTSVGPLASGAYTVEAYAVDPAFPGVPPTFVSSTPLVVAAAPRLVPVGSMPLSFVLALMLLAGGLRMLRGS